jgi:tetratricopeptide (TPR) repeat protein
MLKDYEKAVNRYEALKALGDQSFTTLYYLGISHYGQEWFYGAQENLELAYKKNPTDVNVLYYLAKSCARTSWKAEGIEYMKKALAQTDEQTLLLDSVVVRLYEGLVDCYDRWHESDPYEAIEVMKHTYTLTKKYFLFYKIAEVYDRQEDYVNAVHYYEKYMALVPKDKQVALDAEGNVLTGYMTKYQIAKERITKIKEESFFRDGVK